MDTYYVVRVKTDGGEKYFYNKRSLVSSPEFARKYSTKQNARKCVRDAGYTDFEVEEFEMDLSV